MSKYDKEYFEVFERVFKFKFKFSHTKFIDNCLDYGIEI